MKQDSALIFRHVLSLLVDFGVEASRLFHRVDDDERKAIAIFDRIENLGRKRFGVFAGLNATGYGLRSGAEFDDRIGSKVRVLEFDRLGQRCRIEIDGSQPIKFTRGAHPPSVRRAVISKTRPKSGNLCRGGQTSTHKLNLIKYP